MVTPSHRIPNWAQSTVDKLKRAAKQIEAGQQPQDPSITSNSLDSEDVTVRLWRQREQFAHIRNRDEDGAHDRAPDEPGRFVNRHGTEFLFEGGFLQGEMTINAADESFFQTLDCEGPTSNAVFVNKEGYATLSSYNMAHPEKSFTLQMGERPEVDIPKSPYSGSVGSLAKLLESIPEDAPERVITSVYLDGTRSMPDVREEFRSQIDQGLEKLKQDSVEVAELVKLLDQPSASTARKLGTALNRLSQAHPDNATIKALREKAGFWQVMEDFPRLNADGLGRTMEHYLSPGHLQAATTAQGWDLDSETGLPIADAIIVGAGPGGLATGYHLSEKGKRTVIFEGGHAGQAFSDANAQSVHQLRTNGEASNLIYVGGPAQLGIDVSMARHLSETRAQASEARQDWEESTGHKMQGVSKAGPDDRLNPANRAELFSHMSQVAMGLSQHYPDTFVCENSPVDGLEKIQRGEQTLFKVTTERGHEVLTRSLIMATGFVGGHGEHTRCLNQFKELEAAHSGATVLASDHDLVGKNEQLRQATEGLKEGQLNRNLVISERLLGRPEMRNYVRDLPAGSRVAMIGGGESATKGALEILSLNPEISLDLYTSNPMEPYQTQIPVRVIAPPVVEKSIEEPRIAQRTLDELKDFRTPITPATLESLLEMEQQGRVRIRELNRYFSSQTTRVTPVATDRGQSLAIELIDEGVKQNLRSQREAWTDAGLYQGHPPSQPADQLPNADMVVVAAGYDRKSLRAGPLIQQLIDQDLVELKNGEPVVGADGMTSLKSPLLAFNTAGAVSQAADSAIPARAIKGYRLAQVLDGRLPERAVPEDRIASKLPYGDVDTVTDRDDFRWETPRVEALINNGGFTDGAIRRREELLASLTDPEEKRLYGDWWSAERKFPLVNSPVRALLGRASEVPESLSPIEKVMLERANQVSSRISPELD